MGLLGELYIIYVNRPELEKRNVGGIIDKNRKIIFRQKLVFSFIFVPAGKPGRHRHCEGLLRGLNLNRLITWKDR